MRRKKINIVANKRYEYTIEEKRITAFGIDSLMVSSVGALLFSIYDFIACNIFNVNSINSFLLYDCVIIMIVLFLVITEVLLFNNSSLGKKIMKLEIIYKNNRIPVILHNV